MRSFGSSKPATEYERMSILGLRDGISRFRLKFFPKFGCHREDCRNDLNSYSELQAKCKCGSTGFVHKGSHSDTCSPMPALLSLIDDIIASVRGIDLETSGRIPMKGPEWEGADIR